MLVLSWTVEGSLEGWFGDLSGLPWSLLRTRVSVAEIATASQPPSVLGAHFVLHLFNTSDLVREPFCINHQMFQSIEDDYHYD